MKRLAAAAAFVLLAGCGGSGTDVAPGTRQDAARSWWRWHDEKQAVDLAVADAINAPGGGDYARAVAILRRSGRPAVGGQYEVGLLIVGSFDQPGTRRPAETIAQGLRMIEEAVAQPGEPREVGPQQLRLIFERGAGRPPHTIPVDPSVAACWHGLENHGPGDPKSCIALRRQRLPGLDA